MELKLLLLFSCLCLVGATVVFFRLPFDSNIYCMKEIGLFVSFSPFLYRFLCF